VVRAHVNVPPVATDFTPDASPDTRTGVRLLGVPFPGERPQHFRPPVVITAQLRLPPAETAATFEDNPATATGVELDVTLPVPSSPLSFLPQHLAALFGPVTAHVWPNPVEIDNAVLGEAAPASGADVTACARPAAIKIDAPASRPIHRCRIFSTPLLDRER
jgi:hypothetical protein